MFAMKTTERTIYSDIDRTKEHLFIYFLTDLSQISYRMLFQK